MFNKKVAVLNLGTQNLTLLCGCVEFGSVKVKAISEIEYGGYLDGEFLELDKLGGQIKDLLNNVVTTQNFNVKEIYICVPNAFCSVKIKEIFQNYDRQIRISKKFIKELYSSGNDFSKFKTHTVINSDLISAKTSDGEVYEFEDLINKETSSIQAQISYIFCENSFINIFNELFKLIGIKVAGYICEGLAEVKYLLAGINNYSSCIIDVGHLSTSVIYAFNHSIVSLNEFSLGGGFITADIAEKFNISFATAEKVKRKAILSFLPRRNEFYEIKNNNEIMQFSVQEVNGIVKERFRQVLKLIRKSMQINSELLDEETNFYLTGGGFSLFRGSRDVISNSLGASIEIIEPNVVGLDKPEYSSSLSSLFVACEKDDLGICF